MKTNTILFTIVLGCFLFAGCNSEKKAARYKNIYDEKPAVVMGAKPIDYTPRKSPKEKNAKRHNLELENSNIYFHQSLLNTLNTKGYYVIPYFNTEEILKKYTPADSTGANNAGVLRVFSEKYGVDAILFATIFRWKEEENQWSVYIEYKLKSTKTNNLLFHAKCKGVKNIPYNTRGNIAIASFDRGILKHLEFDTRTLNRMILLAKMNDFVLKNLPNGQSHKDFEKDMEKAAIPEYLEFSIDETGALSVVPISLEQFEHEWIIEE
ncbi:hypothetical protein LJC16_00605 [Bacteroidales bacterium OttesenSCG-928-C19]|nr:hypothetical protein [Bacteroidales bacterium OttesenSCG-928-C19]